MRGIRRRWIILGAIIVSLFGFIFLRGPTPDIKVKPETLFSLDLGPIVFNVTNTILTTWIVVILMVVLAFLATRRWELIPRGVQNVVEAVIEGFYNLVINVAGEKNGRRFFPVVATIFLFILFANWFSLLPIFNVIGLAEEKVPDATVQEEEGEKLRGKFFVMEKVDVGPLPIAWVKPSNFSQLKGESIDEDDPEAAAKVQAELDQGKFVGEIKPLLRGVNTDLNTTLALAIVSAIFVEYWGVSSLGFRTYGRKFFNFGGMVKGLLRLRFGQAFQGAIDAFVGILEFISETVRLISFSFRLFGNMFAGEVVILIFTFLTPLVLTLLVYGLELFVGLVQAFIFAVLTLVFGIMAVTHAEAAHAAGAHEGRESHSAERVQKSET